MIDVASHVISQKSLKRKLFSAISALVLLPVGHVLPFAVVEKLHLITLRIDYNNIKVEKVNHPVGKKPATCWASHKSFLRMTPGGGKSFNFLTKIIFFMDKSLIEIAPEVFLQFGNRSISLVTINPPANNVTTAHLGMISRLVEDHKKAGKITRIQDYEITRRTRHLLRLQEDIKITRHLLSVPGHMCVELVGQLPV